MTMTQTLTPSIVTADEFVAAILCELKLAGRDRLTLDDTSVDDQFALAYDELCSQQFERGVIVDFSLATNPYHGDSSTLRETLYAIRERGIVSINNPSFKSIEIKLSDTAATHLLEGSSLPRTFYNDLIKQFFAIDGGDVEYERGAT
jgi:hypothetical protein